ncbi:MAG: alcohol dehydrogenase [Pseudomonadota bacterium]|jgi:propanol-preferring alcohol dehydrogenase
MRCQCVTQFGSDLDLQCREALVPEGTQIVLAISASGVCHSDLHIRDGGYDLGRGQKLSFKERGMKLPHIPGHEPVGRVLRTGPDVPGDITFDGEYLIYPWQGCGSCEDCSEGRENFCPTPRFLGVHVDGAYATEVVIPHWRYLFPIGELAPELAAPLACSGLTTYSALKKVADTMAREPVVLIGAGGLGLMGISLIRAMGGKAPIVVDIDPAKRAAAVEAGAAHAIDGRDPEAASQIKALVSPLGVRAVVDFVASEPTTSLGFDLLRKGGRQVLVGLFGGAAPWQLPFIPIKSAVIMGSYMGSLPEMRELMALASAGKLASLPTTCLALEDANEALHRLHDGKIIGRAVLQPK